MSIAFRLRSIPVSSSQVYLSSWTEFLVVLSVFTKELATQRIFGIDFDFIAYPFAIAYLLLNLSRVLTFPGIPWKIYAYLFLTSFLSIAIFKYQVDGFLKQFIPIVIIYSVNFYIVGTHNLKYLFQLYVKLAFLSAVFGLFQALASFGGINILIKIPGRLDSIAFEPSHYAAILVPAVVYTFFHFKEYKLYFLVMLAALILTFNLTGYLSFLLVIGFAYINPIYLVVSLPVLYYLVFHVFIDFNKNFNLRIWETQRVFQGNIDVLNSRTEANGTTISLYSNLMVAENNLRQYNPIGSGLGGHEENYYKYFENSTFRLNYFFGLNAPSAHSLTIRIFSELGIVGLVLYVYALAKRVILLDKGYYRSVSLACLSHFICKTFKLGGIIDYGTPFFFAVLFINYLHYRSQNVARV